MVETVEKIEKMNEIKGVFSYKLIDADTGKVLKEFKESNRIMDPVMINFYQMVTQTYVGPRPLYKDFFIVGVAFGDKSPKTPEGANVLLTGAEPTLQAEVDSTGKVYQASWNKMNVLPDGGFVTKTSEGVKGNYQGPVLDQNNEEGMTVFTHIKDGKIRFLFEIERFSGNGHNQTPQIYNEAAIYTAMGKDLQNNKLGTVFAMKRFPDVQKSTNCILSMEWELDFNTATIVPGAPIIYP